MARKLIVVTLQTPQNHSHKNRSNHACDGSLHLALHLVSALLLVDRYYEGDPGIEEKLFLLLVRTLVFPACSSVNNHHRSILMLVCHLGWQQEVSPEGRGTSSLEETGFILV